LGELRHGVLQIINHREPCTMTKLPPPQAVLFDFDGTLADTAPDLVEATQRLLRTHGLPVKPYADLRQVCSSGARGLLGVAFGLSKEDAGFEPMRQAFLTEYRACLTQHTRLFEGVVALLTELNNRGIVWGIVTNKATDLTTPIVQAILTDIGLPPATVVCGDTTPHAKPHPAPLLKACADIATAPSACWYVGDDRRDIECAQASGCLAIGVSFGYHPAHDMPNSWGAAAVLAAPLDLLNLWA
jgi:N-acetyl-D-muramate 6-phosphate phosphatase